MGLADALDRLRRPFEGPNTLGNGRAFWVGFLVVLVGLVGYPIGFGSYAASSAALYLLYAILALSLTVIWGYTGILSFGQVAFFGVAGYSFALISMNLESALTTMLALPVAVGIAALAALVLGYFMFYGEVRDVYVTILTLVVALVLNTFMAQTAGAEWTIGSVALGGFNGIPAIPSLTFGVGEAAITLDGATFYWFTLAALVASYLGLRALVNGRFGYAMVATREDEDRTEMLGYDVRRVKLLVFVLGGALAGLSGVLYATWGNYISPSVFGITFASIPVVWVAVGGRRSLLGAVVATVVIEWFRQQLSATGSQYALIVVGVVLLASILFVPEGVVPRLDAVIRGARDRFGASNDTPEGTPE
ncbi:branched-chain amino acid transport system permease protein [Halarchaeum solikamskense]|uniref:ABC transporter permease subunit n=1 Tax=Halarchaeum nitratireducens TaxID=489913 RepID=UPI001B3AC956|nr:urea ABC transporter permease [Halarchaeum solikamskense]MBP2249735.1 branched-chain amino acid transport system permease protein [Halarchaeum solikamskense]